MRGQRVRERDATDRESACDRLGVDPIGLALVLTDPELPRPRRVDHERLVPPLPQPVVHDPAPEAPPPASFRPAAPRAPPPEAGLARPPRRGRPRTHPAHAACWARGRPR